MQRGLFIAALAVMCLSAQSTRAHQQNTQHMRTLSSADTQSKPDVALTFDQAKAIYEQNKGDPEFQKYWDEFATWDEKFNEDLRRRHDCLFAKGPKTIELLLVIPAGGLIERVLSKEDSPKVLCLRSMYAGLRVKPPPFSPTVLQFEANSYLTGMMITQ